MFRYSALIVNDEIFGYRAIDPMNTTLVYDISKTALHKAGCTDMSSVVAKTQLFDLNGHFLTETELATGFRAKDISDKPSMITRVFGQFRPAKPAATPKAQSRRKTVSSGPPLVPLTVNDLMYTNGAALVASSWSGGSGQYRRINIDHVLMLFAFKSESAVNFISDLLGSRYDFDLVSRLYFNGKRVFRFEVSKSDLIRFLAEFKFVLNLASDRVYRDEQRGPNRFLIVKELTPTKSLEEQYQDLDLAQGLFYEANNSSIMELERLSKLDFVPLVKKSVI